MGGKIFLGFINLGSFNGIDHDVLKYALQYLPNIWVGICAK